MGIMLALIAFNIKTIYKQRTVFQKKHPLIKNNKEKKNVFSLLMICLVKTMGSLVLIINK